MAEPYYVPVEPISDGPPCAHIKKTYSPFVRLTHPPQHAWVCADCLAEGVEMRHSFYKNPPETYEDIIKRKARLAQVMAEAEAPFKKRIENG